MKHVLTILSVLLLTLTATAQQRFDGNFGVGVTVPVAVGHNNYENKYVDVVITGYYRFHLSSRIYTTGELGLIYNRCSDGLGWDFPCGGKIPSDIPMQNNFGFRPGAVVGAHLNEIMDVFTGIYGRFVYGSYEGDTKSYSRAVWQIGMGFNIKRFSIICSYDVMIGTEGGNAVAAGLRYNF